MHWNAAKEKISDEKVFPLKLVIEINESDKNQH